MWRKTLGAVSGIILAGAAAYGLSSVDDRSSASNFDLRWLYPASKGDRLPVVRVRPIDGGSATMAFNVPSANTTIAAKGPTLTEAARHVEHGRADGIVAGEQNAQASAVRVRTIPVNPVRTVPLDEKQNTSGDKSKGKLPVGCEPAFSPVTTPAMAHISSRCDV